MVIVSTGSYRPNLFYYLNQGEFPYIEHDFQLDYWTWRDLELGLLELLLPDRRLWDYFI